MTTPPANTNPLYPYQCRYRAHYNNVSAVDLLNITWEIQEWLYECVYRNGKCNYEWSKSRSCIQIWSDERHEEWKTFSEFLCFTYEEDLLAFKLRFGI
jgi:hypothetical protein